jgi:hypothetical protein
MASIPDSSSSNILRQSARMYISYGLRVIADPVTVLSEPQGLKCTRNVSPFCTAYPINVVGSGRILITDPSGFLFMWARLAGGTRLDPRRFVQGVCARRVLSWDYCGRIRSDPLRPCGNQHKNSDLHEWRCNASSSTRIPSDTAIVRVECRSTRPSPMFRPIEPLK